MFLLFFFLSFGEFVLCTRIEFSVLESNVTVNTTDDDVVVPKPSELIEFRWVPETIVQVIIFGIITIFVFCFFCANIFLKPVQCMCSRAWNVCLKKRFGKKVTCELLDEKLEVVDEKGMLVTEIGEGSTEVKSNPVTKVESNEIENSEKFETHGDMNEKETSTLEVLVEIPDNPQIPDKVLFVAENDIPVGDNISSLQTLIEKENFEVEMKEF